MEEKEQLQISPQKISGLITEPLIAAIAANNKMALAQTNFMLETCFTKNDSGQYKPIMVEMALNRPVATPGTVENPEPTIQSVVTTFSIPLLSIIPLNSLTITEVKLNFDIEVLSVKDGEDNGLPEIYGKVSSEKIVGKPIISYAMHATQMSLPKGVNIVIEAFSQSIQPITIP